MKRIFDFLTALLALIVLSPVIFLVALIVHVRLGSPILFRQQRPGLNGLPFEIYKFRTMLTLFDDAGELLPDSIRLTKLGVFLRKYSLDELPQLLNVVKGELSLVGPRPLLMEYLPLYSAEQYKRHNVRPGITGWAQVNGRNAISWEKKFEYDVWYAEKQSFRLDLKILMLTVLRVIKSDGVSQSGVATVEKFTGTQIESKGKQGE